MTERSGHRRRQHRVRRRAPARSPDKEDQMYVVTRDELYLVPTAEVRHRPPSRRVLEATELPIRYAAYTPCFRREAGAAGKDTRGILRVHQFDKVEMVLLSARRHRRGARVDDRARRGPAPAAGARPTASADEHRRVGLHQASQVRPRGLGTGRGALARGQLVLNFRDFQARGWPSATARSPARSPSRPYAQRSGSRSPRRGRAVETTSVRTALGAGGAWVGPPLPPIT